MKKVVKFKLWLAKKLILWFIIGTMLFTISLIKSKTRTIIAKEKSTGKSLVPDHSLHRVLIKKFLLLVLIGGTLGLFLVFITLKKEMPRISKKIH